MSDARIIVGGFIGLLQAGGVTWDYLQYALGFSMMGFDVYYVEDTRLWPVYQSDDAEGVDCAANVSYLASAMEAFGLGDRWAYRDEVTGRCFGMSQSKVKEVCRAADVFVNISCSTVMRDEYHVIPTRILIDSDPMFTQIQLETEQMFTKGEPGLRELVGLHTHHFTFGLNVGAQDCRIPPSGIDWKTTRQPVCIDHWPQTPIRGSGSSYTTVMNWSAGKLLDYQGESWGQKDIEFDRLMAVPSVLPDTKFAVVLGQTGGSANHFPFGVAKASGWQVLNGHETVADWQAYRSFIQGSRGEFSVAKETYVKANTGWFSCRSACYLASGRPVITQDTGWSLYLPHGSGLLPFDDITGAVAAIREVESDPGRHAVAAREIAVSCFDSRKVLIEMLDGCST